ncbi:DUF4435 domain-containing protein [Puia dinghuensis]|uniref:DUF4435 domain-containing protein n=1 Tax=Puia dinghuensis TaxID=1792502 RepID=A0A8J2XT60_9BACT|nr:DUF4435 domain-containing protein [Puia dinghuensis]GGA96356.1 hypothetical protein GCM10011511_19570 [Puia dinghuensis]
MNVEELRESRKGATVIFTKITRMKEQYPNSLFCCFEGDDAKYYFNRIEMRTGYSPEEIIPFHCGGKIEVLRLYRLFKEKQEYSSIKFLYFIDRDFDEPYPNGQGIYETPVYSVENFYTTYEAFVRILKAEFNYLEDDPEWAFLTKAFKERQDEFHRATAYFNAWLACQRDYSNSNSGATRLNLDDFSLKKIVQTINLDKIESNYDLNSLEALFPSAVKLQEQEIQKKIAALTKSSPQQTFRGKFEVDFLFDFLEGIKIEYAKKDASRLEKKPGFKLNHSKKNMMGEFSQYASTTQCLIEYLTGFSVQGTKIA